MISKFIAIKGTGKFLNYTPATIPNQQWNSEFRRNNLIYGENGSGKTTLSFLFCSLKNDDSLLLKKRSFDTTVEQRIEVLTDDPNNRNIIYSNGAWSNHISNIEIFDTNFISDNIYTGSEIQNIHRKNLLEIIFGQVGVTLKKEISVLKDNIQNNNRDLRNVRGRIEHNIGNAFNIDAYSILQIDPEIDYKIQIKESEINTALNHDEIQQKNILSTLDVYEPPVNYEIVKTILQKSVDSISQEYIDKFKKHCNELRMDNNAEEWITKGYNSIKNDECPFCLRTMDDSIDIFVAYKQYFNQEYIELVSEVKTINSRLHNSSLDPFFYSLERTITSNNILLEFWNKHLLIQIDFTNLLQDKDEIIAAYANYKNTILEKATNPITAISVDVLENFKIKIAQLNNQISLLNQLIAENNLIITELKNRNQVDLAKLRSELSILQAIKKRSEQQIIDDCTEYLRLKNEIENQNAEKDNKQEQLTNYSNNLFTTYSASINGHLRALAPYLRIKNLESGYIGQSKDPFVNYVLEIDGNNISLSENANRHCFKYCFSEGDKSALALAFFLAKLDVDGNINTKIIVFDDPISSFDLNRKTATITQLQNISLRSEQLFILTHNIVFAGEAWKELNQATSQCIKIGYLANSSVLTLFDIKYETLASVLKDSALIKEYLLNGTIQEQVKRAVARAIRPALESYYHLKFFDFVSENEWLGDFIGQVRESQPTDTYYRLQANVTELTDLNNYSKRYHHRFNTNADNEPIVEGELRTYCQRTLDMIQII